MHKLVKFSQTLVIFLYIHGHFRPLALAANSRLLLGKAHNCGFDSCVLCCVPPPLYLWMPDVFQPWSAEIQLRMQTNDTCTNCLTCCAHEQIILQDSNWLVVLLAA